MASNVSGARARLHGRVHVPVRLCAALRFLLSDGTPLEEALARVRSRVPPNLSCRIMPAGCACMHTDHLPSHPFALCPVCAWRLQVDKASDLFISLYNMGRSPQVRRTVTTNARTHFRAAVACGFAAVASANAN